MLVFAPKTSRFFFLKNANFLPLLSRSFSVDKRLKMLKMPALSPTMETGVIKKNHVIKGDKIFPGKLLFEIETDKSTIDWESTEKGFIAKIFPLEAKHIPVGDPVSLYVKSEDLINLADNVELADLENKTSQSGSKDQSTIAKTSENIPQSTNYPHNEINPSKNVKFTPAARQMAKDLNIDTSNLVGTGSSNSIKLSDLNEPANKTPTEIPHSMMTKAIAKRVVQSYSTIPHYYLSIEPCVDNIIALRETIKTHSDDKISMNDILLKIIATVTSQVPIINSCWTENSIKIRDEVNVAFAVATESGLFTPVIENCNKKGLRQISLESKNLIQKAKDNQLSQQECETGSISVSNLGMFGITNFEAIINPPQASIISIGCLKEFIFKNDNIVDTKKVMTMTMGCDHRIINGAEAAKYLQILKKYVENPYLLSLC